MKITCGSCGAKYTVSDEKVQGKTVKVKCRKCGAVIVVSSTGEVQTAGAAPESATGGVTYTVSVSDTDQRSMTMAQIVAAYNEGTIDAETYLWCEGMDDWQPLKDVDAVVDALHDAAAGEPSASEDLGATVAMQDPGGYGSGPSVGSYPPAPQQPAAGLGGTVAMAQSPLAGGSASGGGLFAAPSGGSFGGSSFGDVAAASSGGNGSAVRTEDSAIFSLNMLTQKVGGAAPSSPTTTSEDSGLIDLKALAQGMGGESNAGAAEPPPMASEGLFPLGAPPPQAVARPAAISIPPQATGPGRGLILALAGLVVVMGAALVFILVRDSGPDPSTTTPTTTPEPTTPPTPVATATPTAEPTTAPSAEAAASASASSSAKVAARPPTGFRPPPRGGAASPQPASRPAPAPKSAGGACGCSPDDLMCHMRCSQKK